MFPLSKSPAEGADKCWHSRPASANGGQIGRLCAVVKGQPEIITGQGPGGQAVNIFTPANLSDARFNPTPAFTIAPDELARLTGAVVRVVGELGRAG